MLRLITRISTGTSVRKRTPRASTLVCVTVSSTLSGLKTRSLGLNTLGTTLSTASSQSVQVGRPSTASWVQPVLSKVNVTCSRPQRNVHRTGFEPGTPWSEIRRPNHFATLSTLERLPFQASCAEIYDLVVKKPKQMHTSVWSGQTLNIVPRCGVPTIRTRYAR